MHICGVVGLRREKKEKEGRKRSRKATKQMLRLAIGCKRLPTSYLGAYCTYERIPTV